MPEMAHYQVGPSVKPQDKRRIAILKQLKESSKCKYSKDFMDKYGGPYNLVEQAPSEPLRSPLQAPSKPGAGAGTGAESRNREQRAENSCAAPSPKSKIAALIPACANQQFAVTESKREEYRTAYPGVDVALELRAIRQWCLDNPTRQKTLRGIPRFLNAWLSKAQNSGRRSKKPAQTAEEHLAEINAEEAAEGRSP